MFILMISKAMTINDSGYYSGTLIQKLGKSRSNVLALEHEALMGTHGIRATASLSTIPHTLSKWSVLCGIKMLHH